MSKGRALGIVIGAALAAMVLAGCGGSSTSANASSTSGALDPANHVPDSSVAYASITAKPSGSLKTDLVQTIDKLAGPGSAKHLGDELKKAFDSGFQGKPQPWVGPTIGVALTGVPNGDLSSTALEPYVLIVETTSNPAAAKSWIAKNPPKIKAYTTRVVGNYVIGGGKQAVAAAAATTDANSLTGDSGYKSAMNQIGGNQLASLFVRARPVLQALQPELSKSLTSAQLATTLKKVPADAAVAVGLTAGPHTVSFDAVTQNFPKSKSTGAPSDVGSLPGDSWLALTIAGALADPKTVSTLQHELPALLSQAQSKQVSTASTVQGILPFIQNDVIPALGPISLSAAGTSLGGLHIGFEMTPDDTAAGDKLVTALKSMVQGLPVAVSGADKKVVVTFGYTDAQDFLSPPSKLSGNPTYKAALAQLPAGSEVPLYLDFGPIAALGSSLDSKPSDASTWKIAGKLNYLIAGGTSTHIRVVLAVK